MSSIKKNQIKIHDLGLIDFAEAWKQQEVLFQQNLNYKKQGLNGYHHLILCEHKPVYTIGKSGSVEHLLIGKDERELIGADLYRINRGGDITFHGPGQLVIYPILDLETLKIGLKDYVFRLEQSLIDWLKIGYNINATRVGKHTGVWIDAGTPEERKIAAIGIRSSRFITMHGAAVNVNTDLKYFDYMIPCGIENRGVTSVHREIGGAVPFRQAMEQYIPKFLDSFQLEPFFA